MNFEIILNMNSKINNLPDIEFSYWNNCLIRICLDSVLPMYKGLGLIISEEKKFHQILKQTVTENMAQKSYYPWLNEPIKEEILDRIEKNFNEIDYFNFYYFCTTIFDTHSSGVWNSWSNWKSSLLKFLFPEKYDYLGRYEIGQDFISVRDYLRTSYENRPTDKNSLKAIDLVYDNFSFSKWDRMIFDFVGFNVEDVFNDPYLQLDLTMDMNSFQLFWEKDILTLSENHLKNLYIICNIINMNNNTRESKSVYISDSGESLETIIPGNIFPDLKRPAEMRRKVRDFL